MTTAPLALDCPTDRHVVGHHVMALIAHLLRVVPPAEVRLPSSRSILGLRGLGKEVWRGIDARDYVRNLRDEWDDR